MPSELKVRPTLKRAKFSAALCVLFFILVVWLWRKLAPDAAGWIVIVGIIPFLAPLLSWLDSTRTELSIDNGVVRYRHGWLNHTTRALDLKKLQDVRVERSFTQRLWGVGTLVLETANESGRISVPDIDGAQRVADRILTASQQEGNRSQNV